MSDNGQHDVRTDSSASNAERDGPSALEVTPLSTVVIELQTCIDVYTYGEGQIKRSVQVTSSSTMSPEDKEAHSNSFSSYWSKDGFEISQELFNKIAENMTNDCGSVLSFRSLPPKITHHQPAPEHEDEAAPKQDYYERMRDLRANQPDIPHKAGYMLLVLEKASNDESRRLGESTGCVRHVVRQPLVSDSFTLYMHCGNRSC